MEEIDGPILHVIVVGFHHKKGCQVEYSYPPLVPDAPNECPVGWKYLPTLALPDGSHNYEKDTVYFHLSGLNEPKRTVYGISCYRQIAAEKLKIKTDDITRSTVQKAVCVLSTVPLFGYIQVKISLITHAYFDEGDFSKVSLLKDTYHNLNSCISQTQIPPQLFVGLSPRELVLQWRHKAVLLFKLLLLEKRLIFFKSPVQPLCTAILTLLSLHPGMIERGLKKSACIKTSRPMSPVPDYQEPIEDLPKFDNDDKHESEVSPDLDILDNSSNVFGNNVNDILEMEKNDSEKIVENTNVLGVRDEKTPLSRDTSIDALVDVTTEAQNTMQIIAQMNIEDCGTPLEIFEQGYLCFPYLSLPYMDLLSDSNVRGYIVGATNVLFKQKRQLADVLVDIDALRIESQDPELRRQLHLTTEDLRFADFLVKHVSEERHDVFLDGVGWEGGDEWIRSQFKVYLFCLLRTSLLQDSSREIEHFNSSFVSAWKDTFNYKTWANSDYKQILEVNPGHPFAGQLSVADMKLRLTHTIQNSESGRKINQAMVSTGRVVATTGRAVGGAITQAKGALSNWWSNFTTVNLDDDSQQQQQQQQQQQSQQLQQQIQTENTNDQSVRFNNHSECVKIDQNTSLDLNSENKFKTDRLEKTDNCLIKSTLTSDNGNEYINDEIYKKGEINMKLDHF